VKGGQPIRRLAATTINRIFAAVSSFYEYLILSDQWPNMANPIHQEFDGESARVPDRNRPFLSGISRQRPVRRIVRVRTIQPIPRPMTREQIEKLLGSLQMLRDKALVLLMLHCGLRPGEVLSRWKTFSTVGAESSSGIAPITLEESVRSPAQSG
jgi:integrase